MLRVYDDICDDTLLYQVYYLDISFLTDNDKNTIFYNF